MGVEEFEVHPHGLAQVVRVFVDFAQCGQDGVEPAVGLHPFVVEGGLQEERAPRHAAQVF